MRNSAYRKSWPSPLWNWECGPAAQALRVIRRQVIPQSLEDRADRLANDPAYAEELADLDQRIEDEARAQLQALDDARTLRRTGVKSVHDIGDDDGWDDDFEDDEDGPEIIYVRD